jgi:hypothetical protein
VDGGRHGLVRGDDDLVAGHVPKRVAREPVAGDQRVLHVPDAVREQQHVREVHRPGAPVPLRRPARRRGLDRHPRGRVLLHVHLLDGGELAVQAHDVDALVQAAEDVADDLDAPGHAVDGLEHDVGVAEEEGARDVEQHGVLGHDVGVVHVAVGDPRLREARDLEVDARAPEPGGLVVAVHAGDGVGRPGDHDPRGGGEDDDVGDGVVVAVEADARAGEPPLPGVVPGRHVLAQEAAPDERLVAAAHRDAVGAEVDDVAVVDADAERVHDRDAAAAVAAVQHQVPQRGVLVVVGPAAAFPRRQLDQVPVRREVVGRAQRAAVDPEVAAAGGRQREGPLDEVRAAVEVHLRAAEVRDAAGHGGVGRRAERVGDGPVDRRRRVGGARGVRPVVRHVVHPRARRRLHPNTRRLATRQNVTAPRDQQENEAWPVRRAVAPIVRRDAGWRTSSCRESIWRFVGRSCRVAS